jgi:hypothetical protein
MSLNDKAYEQLWNIYCELGEMERHFNNLQARYRALASTWMLAALAGTGFVISKQLAIDLPKEFIIGAIGVSASIGVGLLWVIDLLIYQRLLDAAYIEGRSLETAQGWLPQFRNNIRHLLRGEGLRLIAWFYMIGTVVMGLVGGIGICLGMIKVAPVPLVIAVVLAYMALLFIVAWRIRQRTSTTLRIESTLKDQRENSYRAYETFEGFCARHRNMDLAVPNRATSADSGSSTADSRRLGSVGEGYRQKKPEGESQ